MAKISFSDKGYGQVPLYYVRYFFSAVKSRKGQAQNSFGCLSVLSRSDHLGFLFSSIVESWRTFIVSENYLLLVVLSI